jgi:hypothetical protein
MALYDSGIAFDSGASYDELSPERRYKMKAKVALGLAELNPAETVQLATNIHTAMTGNANFATPVPALTVLDTKLTAATDKINAYNVALDAAEAAKAARDVALEELRDVLTQLGLYVENVSNFEESIILTAGMNVRSTPAPVLVTQVQDLRLTASAEVGEVFADWKRVPGAKNYRVQTSTDTSSPPSNWTEKLITSKSKCSLNHDLVSGTKVWVRIKALGPNNEGPWSDPAWKTVP